MYNDFYQIINNVLLKSYLNRVQICLNNFVFKAYIQNAIDRNVYNCMPFRTMAVSTF